MSLISVTDKFIAIAKNLQIDFYDFSSHNIVTVLIAKPQENDILTDICLSTDSKYLATITSISKQLIVYDLPGLSDPKIYTLPRSASKIRFTVDNRILVADKSGDVLIYDISKPDQGTKLLGHLSLLLDILQTNDERFIITSDRDEKIRVSCYPNTYNIQTYCLGHKEFVNHIELLPNHDRYLLSSSGDGNVKIWEYVTGNNTYTINTSVDLCEKKLKEEFIKKMDEEGIEVTTLPVVHLSISKLNEYTSLLAVTIHTYNHVLIYSVTSSDNTFTHKLEGQLQVEDFPTAIKLHNSSLYIYNDSKNLLLIYNITLLNEVLSIEKKITENVFKTDVSPNGIENHFESIKVLFKRKFDNVQEYQERKKQRIEKSEKKVNVG